MQFNVVDFFHIYKGHKAAQLGYTVQNDTLQNSVTDKP